MRYLIFLLFFFTFSCAKQKSILICGDHECINKAEAKQYFEENLTIEVQIISNKNKSTFDLVDLNIEGEKPDIKVFKKKNKKIVKKLSKNEIKIKKAELKKHKKKSNLKVKKVKKNKTISKENKNFEENIKQETTSSYKSSNNSLDICLQLKKCDIDSITTFLINKSNEKDFPNISIRK